MSYTIRRGDTLSALAARFRTSVSELARANNIRNVNLIFTGRSLNIPGSRDEFVSGGGTASRVAPQVANLGPAPTGGGSQRLAEAARRVALSMGGYSSQGLCATGVSRALSALGIGVSGNGNQIDNNLPRDKFRQVNMSLEQALRIPGLILTWESTSTQLGRIYGHTAVTLGDGHTSASDFIERNTTNSGRTGFKVFMPIA